MNRLNTSMNEAFKTDVLESLYSKRIHTVLDFLETDSKSIQRASNLTFKEILDIRKSLLKKFAPRSTNAFDSYKLITTTCSIIPTGITSLDALLEGGLYSGNIYEICGLPSSGKTLFCLTLIRNVFLKTPDNVYYLDTKYDFCAKQLKKMLSDANRDEITNVLSRTMVQRTITRPEFMNSLYELKYKLQNGFRLKILIIDSLPVLYNQGFDHTETNSFLNHVTNILHYLSNEYHVVVIVTNLLTLWSEGNFKTVDSFKEKIYCGSYWFNIPNVRLQFKKEYDMCNITLTKTFKVMPLVRECQVQFSEKGIV